MLKASSCERFFYFKQNFDKNPGITTSNYEGLKGSIKHELFQEILTKGESQGTFPSSRNISKSLIKNKFQDFRTLFDRIILNYYEDSNLLSFEKLNELHSDSNSTFNKAFKFKKTYLDNRKPIFNQNCKEFYLHTLI